MSLPLSAPEDVHISSKRIALADKHVQGGLDGGLYPAAVLAVARHGKLVHTSAFGRLISAKTEVSTLFDLASLTKPCVASGLLALIEDGKVSLGQPVSDILSEASARPVGAVSLRQLATHTSGLPPWKALHKLQGGSAAQVADIIDTPLRHPPGAKYAYSDLGYILLGEIVHRASGENLDRFLHSRIFAPLKMQDTGYLPPAAMRERIAPTANSPSRPSQKLVGEVHDENAHAAGGVSGHAGLFGTAAELASFGLAICGNPTSGTGRILGSATGRLARTNQLPPEVGGHSIGWFTPPNSMLPRGDILPDTVFGHTGFTGTMLVCDPATGLVVVLLTNRVMSTADASGVAKIRRSVLNTVASAITR